MHLRIALALIVLRRAWRRDDRGIDDAASLEQQAFASQVRVDLLDEVLGPIELFEHAPKFRMVVSSGIGWPLEGQSELDVLPQTPWWFFLAMSRLGLR